MKLLLTYGLLILYLVAFRQGPYLYAQDQSDVDSTRTNYENIPDSSATDQNSRFFFNDPLMIEEESKPDSHERMFPLWKSVVKDKALPKPWSIGVFQYSSFTDYFLQDATIGVGNLPDVLLDVDSTKVDLKIGTIGIKGGLWLFPFMNINANLAYSWINSKVYMENIPIRIDPPDPPQQPLPEVVIGNYLIELELQGPTMGIATTFAFGWEQIFSTITFSYAYSNLKSTNFEPFGKQTMRTLMFLPKIGYSFEGTSIWLGARLMDDEAHHKGSLNDGDFRFDVTITQNRWSPEVGISTIMGENWELILQAGYAARLFTYFSVAYRL
jgi:hypothetical protein